MRIWFLFLMFAMAALPAAGEERGGLRELLGGGAQEDEPLPPERAFVAQAEALGAEDIGITFTPAPTYYLYRSKFAFAVEAADQAAGVQIKDVQLPNGEMKEDAIFGRTEVYHHPVRALLTMQGAGGREVNLRVTMQGCTERGLCYPPDTRSMKVKLPMANSAAPSAGAKTHAAQPSSAARAAAERAEQAAWAVPTALLLAGGVGLMLWRARRSRSNTD